MLFLLFWGSDLVLWISPICGFEQDREQENDEPQWNKNLKNGS